MSTYVLSDVHGHSAALDAALNLAQPGEHDAVYILGDLFDRGPDPEGVIQCVRSLKQVKVLKGNHDNLLLDACATTYASRAWIDWLNNGGAPTYDWVSSLAASEQEELLVWLEERPLFEVVDIDGQLFLLVHAGIRPINHRPQAGSWTPRACREILAAQDEDDLLWIRGPFWDKPTGFKERFETGPVVIAGHTPTSYLSHVTDDFDRNPVDADGHARMVHIGTGQTATGVADKIAIDCAAAAGFPHGQVGILRLDDGAEFYAPVEWGE